MDNWTRWRATHPELPQADYECPACGHKGRAVCPDYRRDLCTECYCALSLGTRETEFHREFMSWPLSVVIRRAVAARKRLLPMPSKQATREPPKPAEPQPAPKVSAAKAASLARLAKYGSGFASDKKGKPKVYDGGFKTSARKRAYARAYYAAHKEASRESWRRWYYAHREELLASRRGSYNRAYYLTHKDKHRAYMASYRAAHREQIREWSRQYYQRKKNR